MMMVPDLTLLLKKAEEGNLAAFLDGLLSKLSSTGWAYEQITSSSFIGCHPSNRDGQGISAGHVANLCSEIFDLSWCSSFQNPIAVECKPQEFGEFQSNIGFFNWAPRGVLRDLQLRENFQPITATCFDPMHIYFVNGLFHLEVTLLLSVLYTDGIKREQIHIFLQDWNWPAAVRDRGSTGKNLFAKKVDGDFKSSAREALALYPVLRIFISELPRSSISTPAIKSFLALCLVLDDIRLASAGAIDAAVLLEHIRAHLKAFQLAHGLDRFLPKANFSLHLPDQLAKHGVLMQCFTHERRHKEIKKYANNYCTGIETVEKSLLTAVFLTHALDLQEFSTDSSLVKWKAAGPECVMIFVQNFQIFLQSELLVSAYTDRCKVGDVVVVKEPRGIGEVICNFKYEDHRLSLISFFEQMHDLPNTFRVRSNPTMVVSKNIQGPSIFKRSGDMVKIAPESFFEQTVDTSFVPGVKTCCERGRGVQVSPFEESMVLQNVKSHFQNFDPEPKCNAVYK